MVSEGINNGMSHPIVFQDEAATVFNSGRKTASVSGTPSGFVDQKLFPEERERYFRAQGDFRRDIFEDDRRNVDVSGYRRNRRPDEQQWHSRDGSNGENDDDDDDDGEDDEGDDDEGVTVVGRNGGGKESNSNGDNSNNSTGGSGSNNSGGAVHSVSEKVREGNLERENGANKGNSDKYHPSFGMSRGALIKDPAIHSSNVGGNLNECQSSRLNECGSVRYSTAVTLVESDSYYPHILQGLGSSIAHKETGGDNGRGFNGRKDASLSSEPRDSLKAILSDPFTGMLMDDAMILACGHSFGSGGMQHVLRMETSFRRLVLGVNQHICISHPCPTKQACSTCGHSVSADSVAPNLLLRTAVQAFRHEEAMQLSKASKRRREHFEQEKGSHGDLVLVDGSRSRGVQFPFAIGDRVIIQGNKRTPQRFVGREAIVTTQCLNGWYVVKTLDNAESVKLQYRSLSKVGTCTPSSSMSTKPVTPNWL